MNINFWKIRWKNLLSTGNQFTEIDFRSSKMALIVGQNGAGKSTLLDALTFVLFGKPFRKINKPQLINSITKKELVVEVELAIKGANYKIVRGIKPAVFEIWKDGVLINQDAKSGDYQSHLEKHILRTNYKTFCQIVILGSASFVPFMQLPGGQRREITEDVLDLQIFTSMNSLLKEKMTTTMRVIDSLEREKEVIATKARLAKEHTSQLLDEKLKQIIEKEEMISEQAAEIDKAKVEIDKKQKEVALISLDLTDHASVSSKHKKLQTLRAQLMGKVNTLTDEIKFLDNHDSCPTCKQIIDGSFKEETKCSKHATITEVQDGLVLLEQQYDEIEARLTEIASINKQIADINVEIYVLNTKIDGAVTFIKRLERELETLKSDSKSIFTESDASSLELELKQKITEYEELERDQYMMEYAAVQLKDTGIKARIIKQYIPIINKLINKYLAALEFFVDFELNENFEETIKSRGRDDFSYNSFSEGEKMRIDLAVLFAWRAVAKLRSSINTNILIMDEVFDGSLDASGIDEFMKILTKITGDNNVFIISHKTDQLWDKFERVIRFEKVKNFSQMVS